MSISIIIPTYNEEKTISRLVSHLQSHAEKESEIIIVDGGSNDDTLAKAKKAGACCITSPRKGRAVQMNEGAAKASGEIFYFVHADSFPPPEFCSDITNAIKGGFPSGCYRFQFDSDHPLLKINSYMTRFDHIMCRGGDQTLFITRELFIQLGGYRDDYGRL